MASPILFPAIYLLEKIQTKLFMIIVMSQGVWAFQPSVLGGVRGGLALGMMVEAGALKNAVFRMGLEASTANNPIILFLGGKFYLTSIGRRIPMSLGLGLVGYAGKSSEFGLALSFIFDRAFDIKPLFIEAGVDVVGSGKLQAQVGYKL